MRDDDNDDVVLPSLRGWHGRFESRRGRDIHMLPRAGTLRNKADELWPAWPAATDCPPLTAGEKVGAHTLWTVPSAELVRGSLALCVCVCVCVCVCLRRGLDILFNSKCYTPAASNLFAPCSRWHVSHRAVRGQELPRRSYWQLPTSSYRCDHSLSSWSIGEVNYVNGRIVLFTPNWFISSCARPRAFAPDVAIMADQRLMRALCMRPTHETWSMER